MLEWLSQYPWVIFIVSVGAALVTLRLLRPAPIPPPSLNHDLLPLSQLRLWQALAQVNNKDWVAVPEVKLPLLFQLHGGKRYKAKQLEPLKKWTIDFVLLESESGKPMVAVCLEEVVETEQDIEKSSPKNQQASEAKQKEIEASEPEQGEEKDPFEPLAEHLLRIQLPLIVVAEQSEYSVRELRRSIQGALGQNKAA